MRVTDRCSANSASASSTLQRQHVGDRQTRPRRFEDLGPVAPAVAGLARHPDRRQVAEADLDRTHPLALRARALGPVERELRRGPSGLGRRTRRGCGRTPWCRSPGSTAGCCRAASGRPRCARTAGASKVAHPIGAVLAERRQQHVAGQGGLARSRRAGDHRERPERDLAVDVAQVAQAGAGDADPRRSAARTPAIAGRRRRSPRSRGPTRCRPATAPRAGPGRPARPPARPPPGPISTTSSAMATATGSCSTISTGPGSDAMASSSRLRSLWCRPMVGSSRTCSRSSSRPAEHDREPGALRLAARQRRHRPVEGEVAEAQRLQRTQAPQQLVLEALRPQARPAAARRTRGPRSPSEPAARGSVTPAMRCDDVSDRRRETPTARAVGPTRRSCGQIGARSTGVPPSRTSGVPSASACSSVARTSAADVPASQGGHPHHDVVRQRRVEARDAARLVRRPRASVDRDVRRTVPRSPASRRAWLPTSPRTIATSTSRLSVASEQVQRDREPLLARHRPDRHVRSGGRRPRRTGRRGCAGTGAARPTSRRVEAGLRLSTFCAIATAGPRPSMLPDLRGRDARSVAAERQRLDEPATRLGVDHVERQRRLARSRHADDRGQPGPEGDVDIAQVVLGRAVYVEESLVPAPRARTRPGGTISRDSAIHPAILAAGGR